MTEFKYMCNAGMACHEILRLEHWAGATIQCPQCGGEMRIIVKEGKVV